MRGWIASLVFIFVFCSVAAAQSVTGTWPGTWSWTQCPSQWTCDIGVQHSETLNLAQNGNSVTGTGQFEVSYTVTGTLSGSTLNFTLTPTSPNGDLHSTCVVQITGNGMSGPCTQFWNGLSGSWSLTAQRNPLSSNSFSSVVSYPTTVGTGPNSMDVADLNKDGFPDIVVVNLCYAPPSDCRTSLDVMLNNGNGTFQSPLRYATDGSRGNSVAIADVDGDGNPDLAVTNTQYPFPTVSVMRGNGNGTFQPAVSYVLSPSNPNGPVPNRVIAADVNGDGKLDLLVALVFASAPVRAGAISVLLNHGDGTFLAPTLFDSGGYDPTDLVAVDINGDSIRDLVALNRCGSSNCNAGGFGVVPGNIGLLLGNGNGTFQQAVSVSTGGYSPYALAAVDLNGDGNQDLVTHQCPIGPGCGVFVTAAVLLGNGHGNFSVPANYSASVFQSNQLAPGWLATGDLDGDGYSDVVMVNVCDHFNNCNALSGTASVLRGIGDGTLQTSLLITVGNFPEMVVVKDVNGDGKPDMEILMSNGGVGVVLNQTPRTPVTLDTLPSGLTVFLNGVSATAPKTYPWAPNSLQQISTSDLQQVTAGSRFKFSGWSDGGALTHTVTVPSSPITYTATFKTQYLLTTNTDPLAGGSITPGDWFDSGTIVGITAAPAAGYGFAGFSGDLSGTTNPGNITMNAAKTVTANFKGLTTTSLSTSPNPNTFGQAVTMTATVTSPIGTPSGTVTFYDGTTSLGNQPLDISGQATLISALTAGTHSLTASYVGNVSFFESTSAPLTQTVNKASSSTTVSSSLNPSAAGQVVTFTVLVSSNVAVPTGSVVFKDGGTLIGTGHLNASGQATFSTGFNVGSHGITAEYSGDANFLNSSSSTLSQTVNRASTTTTVTSAPNPSLVGQAVTFTATVVSPTGGIPAGTVAFGDGDTTLGTSPLDAQGKAVFVTTSLSARTHLISAVFAGTANYGGSASLVLKQVVALVPTETSVTSSQNPSAVGQSVTFTATVTGTGQGIPTGTVTFKVGGDGVSLGTATLSGGQAAISISNLKKGTNRIFVVYGGDATFAGSVSPVYMQVVN
jgi:hypothetical protein